MKSPVDDDTNDEYIPAGLANKNGENSNGNSINDHRIYEFYNTEKPINNVTEKSTVETFVDLSGPNASPIPRISTPSFPISCPDPRPALHIPVPNCPPTYRQDIRSINNQNTRPEYRQVLRQDLLPTPQPELRLVPISTIKKPTPIQPFPQFYPNMEHHGAHLMAQLRMIQRMPVSVPVMASGYVAPRPIIHPPSNIPFRNPINGAPFNPSFYHPLQMLNNNLASLVRPPPSSSLVSREMMVVPQRLPHLCHPTGIPQPVTKTNVNCPSEDLDIKPELPILPMEDHKKVKMAEEAKAKAERDALKAIQKAKRRAERSNSEVKRKKINSGSPDNDKKLTNFSKDMFVIRLKDIDSFDRNNEIWRIDNHFLVQKFSGVASLRAPARQFQSTNKLSGYDARATWRFFIINPEDVEVEKHGSEITVHNFPAINVLRDAKQLAEIKDEEFRMVEQNEYVAKLKQFEAKQVSRTVARQKRRAEKIQKKKRDASSRKVSSSSSCRKSSSNWSMKEDDAVCRDVVDGLLDAVDDRMKLPEPAGTGDWSDGSSCCNDDDGDDDDDAGSLYTLMGSTDSEEEDEYTSYTVLGEDEVPAVGLELTI